jgi:hypothetical protein
LNNEPNGIYDPGYVLTNKQTNKQRIIKIKNKQRKTG